MLSIKSSGTLPMTANSAPSPLTVRYRNKRGAGCMATITSRAEAEKILKGERGEMEATITNAAGATIGERVSESGKWQWYLDLDYFSV
jgi:hypothetical protein